MKEITRIHSSLIIQDISLFKIFQDGPIPGEPVLQTLLSSGNETIGYLLLKNIGIQDKVIKEQEEITHSEDKVYGCQMPKEYKIPKNIENRQYKISQIYQVFLKNPKSNTFGLGYEGLDKTHIDLFQSSSFVVQGENNKKISIRGQAFGVGAFEEEDDDIYAKDDMTKYDFELTKEKSRKKESSKQDLLYGLFKKSEISLSCMKLYPPPNIPHSFTGKHKIKKSRFEPITEPTPIDRKVINPLIRAEQLGEITDKPYTESKSSKIETKEETNNSNAEKGEKSSTKTFDVSSLLISDRFISATQNEDVSNILEPVQKSETTHGTKDQREAAKMKMFGRLTRITTDWHPNSVLCKRFNVPEPFMDRADEKNKKRTKNIIFQYQKHTDIEDNLTPGLSVQIKQQEASISETTVDTVPQDYNNVSNTDGDIVSHQRDIKNEVPQEDGKDNMQSTVIPKDITEKVDVVQNLDLFKTVFFSSSESEEENEEVNVKEKIDTPKLEEMKANVLSDSFIPKIKPIKEGILSNVSFHTFSKPKKDENSKVIEQANANFSVVNSTEMNEAKTDCYGPVLPSKKIEIITVTKTVLSKSDSEEEWVEKSDDIKKKVKHKKKHKKEKHKKHRYEKKRSKSDK